MTASLTENRFSDVVASAMMRAVGGDFLLVRRRLDDLARASKSARELTGLAA
jgi:hypothetical protein